MRSGRRNFLLHTATAGGAGLLGCGNDSPGREPTAENVAPVAGSRAAGGPLIEGLPEDVELAHFVVHGTSPLTMESRRAALGTGVVTPSNRLFVRNNLPMPPADVTADAEGFTVRFDGFAGARELTVAELKSLGIATVAAVLQCSGNGRKYFAHDASGAQWGSGAAGCVIWTGVPLRSVFSALGGRDVAPRGWAAPSGVRFLTATGAEVLPEGVDADSAVVERSIPIEKALDDCLLAWEMNGEPISAVHGGPLRLVVPGYYGCNNIKWVKRIALTSTQSAARMMRSGYRVRPLGESGAEDQPTMWEMNVKSFVVQPTELDSLAARRTQIVGVAFSGGAPIERVEVSVDGGASWGDAELFGADLGRYAWRQFRYSWDPSIGEHVIAVRATDASGATQPETPAENERGYGNNAWRDHAIPLTVCEAGECNERRAEPSPAFAELLGPRGELDLSEEAMIGRRIFMEIAQPSCTTCHTLSEAGAAATVGPNLDQSRPNRERVISAVSNGVGIMPAMRDSLSEGEIRAVARYLFEATGGRPAG